MSAIKNLDESWENHTFQEIEDFIKSEMEYIESQLNPDENE